MSISQLYAIGSLKLITFSLRSLEDKAWLTQLMKFHKESASFGMLKIQYKKENTYYKDQISVLKWDLSKLGATEDSATQNKQEIADLKKAQKEQAQYISEMEQKVELLETLKHKIHEEKQEIEQDLSDRIVALEQDVARRNKIIANQKKRIDGLANSEALEQKNEILSQKHNQLCDSIEVMLYCKETNDPMKTPCFTPSGNTVDKEVMEMWIQDGQKDPWNGKPCIEVTKNLLAEDLGILLEQYKAKSQV